MKLTKVTIKNMYGIKSQTLEPKDITIFQGENGLGKTSFLDSVATAFTNKGMRPRIISNGEEEGEIQIETDSGLNITRKKRTLKSDYNRVSRGEENIASPEAYLKELFNTNQINPIEFIELKPREQCKILLSMLDIKFTTNDYIKHFGIIPPDYNEELHVLEMLDYLQSNKSKWWDLRAEENKQELFKRQAVEDDLLKLPNDYDCKFWEEFRLSTLTEQISKAEKINKDIDVCKNYVDSEAEKKAKIDQDINLEIEKEKQERFELKASQKTIISNADAKIEELKKEIQSLEEDKKQALNEISKIESNENLAIEKIELQRQEKKKEVDLNIEKSKEFIANNKMITDEELLEFRESYNNAEKMKEHVSFYKSIMQRKAEQEEHREEAAKYDELINIARNLPSELMKGAKCPIDGISVENGEVLLNGKPIGNLSEGEQLMLAFDVAMNQVGELKIVLADGFEKLSKNNRDLFIEKAKTSGLQFFITRVTDDEELNIVEL